MKITDLLKKDTIILDLQADAKEAVLSEIIEQLDRAGRLHDNVVVRQGISAREAESTTGVREAIAILHAKSAAVALPAIAFGRFADGIDFASLDGQPAHFFFMIAASEGANNEHLEALSRLSTFLMDPKFQEKMYNAASADDVLQAVNEKEAELDAPEEETT